MSKKDNTKKQIQKLLSMEEIPETRPEKQPPQKSKKVASELREAVLHASKSSKKDKSGLEKISWGEFLNAIDRDERIGFRFDQEEVTPIEDQLSDESLSANALLKIGDEVFGKIQLDGEQNISSENEKILSSIAQQVSQHIENLRLVEQANQYRAEAEEASRLLTQQGWDEYLQSPDAPEIGYIYDQKRVIATNDLETITNLADADIITTAGSPVRASSYTPEALARYPWLAAQRAMLARARPLPADPRLGLFLGDLYEYVHRAFTGEMTPAAALQAVQSKAERAIAAV